MTIAMTMGTTIVMTTLMTINYDNLYDKILCMSMPAIMMTLIQGMLLDYNCDSACGGDVDACLKIARI